MKRKSLGLIMLCLFALTFAMPGEAREKSRWDFTVYLDKKKIGNHTFEVTNVSGVTEVLSEANFKYTILLIPAYRYEHTAAERWSNNCLVGLDARLNNLRALHEALGDEAYRPSELLERLVDAGRLGKKSGQGVYRYADDGQRIPGSDDVDM